MTCYLLQIWSAEIKELETLYTLIKGRFPELEKELERLIKADDENMVLLYSRRCLEVIITDLCEHELKRPRKTEPLKGIIDKLNREEKVPSNIIASMQSLNSLSTFGAHPKNFDPEQVKPILNNLTTIIKWYQKYKDTQVISKPVVEEVRDGSKVLEVPTEQLQKPKKKLILLLSGFALVVVIVVVALFVFDIIGGGKRLDELEKSIAVLPFLNDSQDEENTYFINGIMDEILINLQTVKDLRVPGRTSVEQYRNQTKSIPEIAKELNVNYIVEGSGQKYGNTFRLRVQLIEAAKDKHLLGEVYEQKIEEVEDIFKIQGQIAEAISKELKAAITPEEKQLIEKTPTTSLTALDFFQRGREEHWKYQINGDRATLEKAEDFYHKAMEYDSTFAQAYTGLAWVYWDKHYLETYFSEEFLDSFLILTNIALSYDDQLSEAYTWKGRYYYQMDKPEQAIKEFDKAIKYNPNDWMAYRQKGNLYSSNDFVKSIDNYQKAISLNRGEQLPGMLRTLGFLYYNAGFTEEAINCYQEAFKLDGDSLHYIFAAGTNSNLKWGEFLERMYEIDSTNLYILYQLGYDYMRHGQHEEALKYFEKCLQESDKAQEIHYTIGVMHRYGYVYWQNGYKEEAEYYFDMQLEYCNRIIELGRGWGHHFHTYYDLAGVHAFRGDKDKAYENLRIFNQSKIEPLWMVNGIKDDPLFDSIRDEPEFQQIVRDVEVKYQAEHERVKKWLEEQEDLPG